jgi:signal transduction histidine kinase
VVLDEREARGLRAPVITRLLIGVLIAAVVIGEALTSELPAFVLPMFVGISVLWFGVNIRFYGLLKRRRHVATVGVVGAVLDVVFVAGQLAMMGIASSEIGVSVAIGLKSQVPLLSVMLLSINGLTLRPRYPLIVGVGSILALGLTVILGAGDPTFRWSGDPAQYLAGPAFGPSEVIFLFLFASVVTAAVGFVMHTARRMIRQTIEQELERADLERQQLETLMREKMNAMAKLVAGVSHELNSPLGVMKSGLQTQTTALSKLDASVAGKPARMLAKAREVAATLAEAVERIDETATSLRRFAHLDEADLKSIDLRETVDVVLSRVPKPSDKRIDVTRSFDEVPAVTADARAIAQALATIVENAYEALATEGSVEARVEATETEVTIAIADDGPGMSEQQLANLFEIQLADGDRRVAARFGLPTAQSILQRHGGRITVESHPGEGTTFILHLPRDRR